MSVSETLQDTITRLTTLRNELSSLRKTLTTKEQLDKVLRILPKANWDVKVTAIRKAKDMTSMTLDQLVGNLKTYEMNMTNPKKVETKRVTSLKSF